ncbi:MAG: WYL domain-containing protein [Solobacterium sp.]|jgi:hypothetical protein|nr:WYL domain-containing protein [Solobacterium sp.]MCH4206168.1 WYL domain-containing protein [Solobacterium sp.]MCH4227634.1 WYL domain-containing protein [Solobacterium sp.]MCH4282566.1 WYL domain-containing protein [Solobacterium sp.]
MNKRYYMQAIQHILIEYTDDKTYISRHEILDLMEKKYGWQVSKNTFLESIKAMNEDDHVVSTFAENRKGYRLLIRPMDSGLVTIICHTVHSSPSLPNEAKLDIEKRFLCNLSHNERKIYNNMVFLPHPTKNGYFDWLPNMNQLAQAFHYNKRIKFDYIHHTKDHTQVKTARRFDAEPRYIIQDDAKTYLICTGWHDHPISHFRVDKMRDIELSEEDITSSQLSKQDAYDYAAHNIFMFGGEIITARVRCKDSPYIYDKIVDELGDKVPYIRVNDEWFDIVFKGTVLGVTILVSKYMDMMVPIDPPELVDRVVMLHQEALDNIQEMAFNRDSSGSMAKNTTQSNSSLSSTK